MDNRVHQSQTGRYSPLRYPGGKGKIVRFIRDIIRLNGLSDGRYVEPYAGGAAVAWELLITGVVRRVSINDISKPVYAFWHSVLNQPEALCSMITERPVTVDEWDRWKEVYRNYETADELELGFAFFYLNRTNRSGILNGGIIGGRDQSGQWKIDARYNKADLKNRIMKISSLKSQVDLTRMDAVDLLQSKSEFWESKTLVYLDPPYFEKGQCLYLNAYGPNDHKKVANAVTDLRGINWIVSYDDVSPIHDLYQYSPWLQYTLNYSASGASRGREAMFFSDGLMIPEVSKPLIEFGREVGDVVNSVSERLFAV
jgi:DNA adenine methylase